MATLQTFLIIRVVTVLLLCHFDVRSGIILPIDQVTRWLVWHVGCCGATSECTKPAGKCL
jgi:hypothetical protein